MTTDFGKPYNQTGIGTALSASVRNGGAVTIQGSASFGYAVPMFNDPGRAKMDVKLGLFYNSHIWVSDATGGMMLGFDRSMAPGFQFNFGFLEWNPSANGPAGILTGPDGAKHTMSIDVTNLVPKPGPPPNNLWYECANQICLYDTDDSSYINVARPLGTIDGNVCQGPNNCPAKDVTVTYKNGTTALYQSFAVVTNDIFDEFVMRPYLIQDSNGNRTTISYINNNDLSIDTITDSLGRTLKFFYNFVQVQMVPGQAFQTVPLLNCVTDGASCNAAGARTYTFTWDQSHVVSFNFSTPGQVLLAGTLFTVQNGFKTPVLTSVCRPDTTCVTFNYGDWGIVNDIQELSTNGTVRYELSYDFPAAGTATLSSNPTYTHQVEKLTGIQCPPPGGPPGPPCTNGQTNTWTYAINTNTDGFLTSSSITDPSYVTTTTAFSHNGDWQDGLPTQIQRPAIQCPPPGGPPGPPCTTSGDMVTRNITWTSDLAEAQSGITNGGYPTGKNPRPASVTIILADNSQSQVTMQYDNSAVPVAAGAPQPFTGSGSITDKVETDFGAGAPGTMLRETVSTYTSLGNHILGLPTDIKVKDGTGKVVSHTKMAYDGGTIQSISPLPFGHDNVGYSASSTAPRGNLTTTTMYADPVGDKGGVTTTYSYDMLGNKISEQTGCCTQTAWIYSSNTVFAYPDSVVMGPSGNQLQTSFTYNQNTGSLASTTDWNGNVTSFNYDGSGRLTSSKGPDGVTQTTAYDDNSANPAVATSSSANSRVGIHTVDSRGRALSDQVLNGSTPVSTITYINDSMGRPVQVSNPYALGETSLYTTYVYDSQGRVIQTTPPALSPMVGQKPYVTTYSGSTTLSADPAGHQSKTYSNGLGQVVRLDQPGPTGGAAGTGSLTISGSEQTASTPTGGGATPGTGNVTIAGTENSTQVLTHAATQATGSVRISGSEQSKTFPPPPPPRCPKPPATCDQGPGPGPTTVYDTGTVSIAINGTVYSTTFGQNDDINSIAGNLAIAINNGSLATATASGATVNILSRNAVAGANFPLSASYSWNQSTFQSPSFTATALGASLTGGTDNAFRTEYNQGNVTITVTTTVNGVSTNSSKAYTYGQNDTTTSIASGLASLMHGDTSFPVDATTSGTVINLITRITGNGTGDPLAVSAITTDQYFSASAFTATASGPNLSSGQNGVVADSGTINVTLKTSNTTLYTQSVNYGLGSTPATLANSLVLALNGDSKSLVNASVGSGSGAIRLTAKVAGASTNFTVTAASATTQGTYFSQPSFAATASSLTGGADPSFSLSTPIITSYINDPYGRLLQVNTGQQTQTYVYDGLGRMTSSTTPEAAGLPVTYTYTDFGAVAQRIDPRLVPGTANPIQTTYAYDSLNRVKTITYNDNNVTPNVTYTYNAPNSANNTGGRLASVSSSVEKKDYQYDPIGRITQCLETIGANQYVVKYTYAADGQRSSITYPSQLKVSDSYDPIGRLTQLGTTTQNILSINPADYNAAGTAQTITYGNNVKGTFGFNNQLQISSIQYAGAAPATPLLSLTYLYGGSADNGEIQGVTDNLDANRSTRYIYDDLGRLQTAQTVDLTALNSWQLTYGYDIYGNRLSETPTGGTGSMPSNYVAVDPTTNRVQGSGALYDVVGNMVSDGVNNNVFNADNQLVSTNPVPGLFIGSPSTFSYGPDGALVNRDGANFVYAGGQIIAEYANGAPASSPSVEYINLGGRQLATVAGGAVTFNFADHLSTRVTADLSGHAIRTYGHFPTGETLYQTGGPSDFQFTSYRRDANSGLDYANARFYSSRLGRFLSPDPILGGGYAYANSDPINLVDPLGRDGGMPCSLDPFHNFGLPLCGPDQIGGGVGSGGSSCGFTFGDNLSFSFSFSSNCNSFSLNFNDSLTKGPFGSYQDSLLNLLGIILPIDTCPAGTFECPENGAPLFGQPTCDPRWCLMDLQTATPGYKCLGTSNTQVFSCGNQVFLRSLRCKTGADISCCQEEMSAEVNRINRLPTRENTNHERVVSDWWLGEIIYDVCGDSKNPKPPPSASTATTPKKKKGKKK